MTITTSSKRSKTSIIKKDVVGDVAGFLQELPNKPRSDLSLKEAVRELQELIRAAFSKGYTYVEVAEMLTSQGIKISAFTLKSYVPAGKQQTARGKARRSKKLANNPADNANPNQVEIANTANGVQPATGKRGNGRSQTTGLGTAAKASTSVAKTTAKSFKTVDRNAGGTKTKRSKRAGS
jgi:hypothetical protein